MITRFHVENFKSLAKFDLTPPGKDLAKFTCLIGLNGSGKSTLLQALDFAAHIVTGKVAGWLEQRDWEPADVLTRPGNAGQTVVLEIGFRNPAGVEVTWRACYSAARNRCEFETVESEGRILLKMEAGRLSLAGPDSQLRQADIELEYSGSVLWVLNLREKHPALALVKERMQQVKSLELLSPQLLRKRAREATDIGAGGEKLSAFLDGLSAEKVETLLAELQKFYPRLVNWRVKSLQSGWKALSFVEHYGQNHAVAAEHINDGFLRVMAILSQAQSAHTCLLFDEIENGISPELVEKLVDFLVGCGKQVIVTTHSPMILNYIPDPEAKEGIILLYKTSLGETKATRFFDLPAMEKKLRVLGPGEVFADTRLSELVIELESRGNGQPALAAQP